ncbi:unnamed protein product [Didymodactylos carnosus]|uniref:Uncharacterized protein n=1 Tax=Didymodactylos carnosus TaxID=1234261 RepID=A0A8S2E2C2_9BILA|nr:unnamed protein product [Didymodactylos carnosus]CAF3853067.1 unnamed protein product [Didymodactylos carnosus]
MDTQDDSSNDEQKKTKPKEPERKKKVQPKRKRRSKHSANNERKSHEKKHTGLNGSYWQTLDYDRHDVKTSLSPVQSEVDDSSSSQMDLTNDPSHNSTTVEPKKVKSAIYRAKTYITCRSPEGHDNQT